MGDLGKGHWHTHETFVCTAEVVILEEHSSKCLQLATVFGIRFRCINQYMHLKNLSFALVRISSMFLSVA